MMPALYSPLRPFISNTAVRSPRRQPSTSTDYPPWRGLRHRPVDLYSDVCAVPPARFLWPVLPACTSIACDVVVAGGHDEKHQTHEVARTTSRMEALKEAVRKMLRSCTTSADGADKIVAAMRLVDAVQRLGLSYHFQEEIADVLRRIRSSQLPIVGGDGSSDLFQVSLRFRLLRQSGIWVSNAVFDMFKDDAGNFNVNLQNDAEGMLSLYNAAYLKIPGEETLDEAISFARDNLRSMCGSLEQPLKGQVMRYLDVPLWRRMRRLETRYYISEYELELAAQGTPEYGDAYALLELAKLDFNHVQSLHQDELRNLSRWWEDICNDRKGKIGFVRNRMQEGFLWVMGMHHEPHWARTRTNVMKVFEVALILDDLADSHATPREFHILDQAVQRWIAGEKEPASVSLVPEYMDYVFKVITSTFRNLEETLKPEEKYRMANLRQSFGVLCAAGYKEMDMFSAGSMPSFVDHLDVTTITTAYPLLLTTSVVSSTSDEITDDALRWLLSIPKPVKDCAKILRFLNDTCSREREKDRSKTLTTIGCYQDEHQVSWSEGEAAFLSFTEDAWAELNKVVLGQSEEPELRSPTPVIAQLLIDYARIATLLYGSGVDRFTDEADGISRIVSLLFFEHFEV